MRRGVTVVFVAAIPALLFGRWGAAEERGARPSPTAIEAIAAPRPVVAARPASSEGRHAAAATLVTLPTVALALAATAWLAARRTPRSVIANDVDRLGRSERSPPR
jgi:hypothetical protein